MWTLQRQLNGNLSHQGLSIFERSKKEELLQYFSTTLEDRFTCTDSHLVDIPPYACSFFTAPGCENICLIADEDGFVIPLNTEDPPSIQKENVVSKKWRCHHNAIFDVACANKSTIFATASGDTTAKLWDLTTPGKALNTFRGHSCSLKTTCISKHNSNLLATGSRDGNAFVWDSRQPNGSQPCIRVQDAHVVHDALTPQRKRRRTWNHKLLSTSSKVVTSVLFQDSNTLITSGAMDGTIKLWDLRKISSVKQSLQGSVSKRKSSSSTFSPTPAECITYPGSSSRRRGYNCLTLDSTHSRLYASCTDNTIYEFNLINSVPTESRLPIHRYVGHYSPTFYVRISLSPDDLFLLSGCGLEHAYVWNTMPPSMETQPSYCITNAQMEQVTSVAWCPLDWGKLITCSDDCAVRIWRLPQSIPAKNKTEGCFIPMSQTYQNRTCVDYRDCDQLSKADANIVSFSPASNNSSPSSLTCSSSQKKTQPSLSKWFQQRSRDKGIEKCKAAKCLDIQMSEVDVEQDKENKVAISPDKQSADERSIKQTLKTRQISSLEQKRTNTTSPGKVDFRSRKPLLTTDQSNTKKYITMEDYFRSEVNKSLL